MQPSAAVVERVRNLRHAGWLPRDAVDVGTGEAGDLDDGTLIRIQVRVDATRGRVTEAVFKAFGCSAAIASASLVAERLQGQSLGAAREMEALVIAAELQLPAERAAMAGLAVTAARRALEEWERKQ